WCGAQDERVALTISNNSGCTGAALACGTTGETVRVINEKFPHWFAQNYHDYADREHALPVDQHALIALMAPRLVYVARASEDANVDPRAEFRACVAAGPALALQGLAGVGRRSHVRTPQGAAGPLTRFARAKMEDEREND